MEINFNENSDATIGRLNHPDDIKKYFSSKTFKDFLADKTSPLVYSTLTMDGKEFLNKSSFEITLNQKTNSHDSFEISVPSDALDGFSGYILENSKNILGKKITINFHRFGEIKTMFSGIISKIKNKKENGYGKLFITGSSPSILLESGKDCRSFEEKNLEQIIKEVTSEYPEEAKIDASNIINSTYPIPYTVQYKESDYEFIQRLAKRYGEYFYYNGQQLVFGNKVQPIIVLEEGADLIEAEFELSIKPQDFKYMVYDSEKGSKTEKESSSSQIQYKENPFQAIAVTASKNVFKKNSEMLFNHTGNGIDTDKALSEAVRRERENRENLITVIGKSKDPNLKIGGRAKLIDINDKAMETYRIIEIKHFHNGNEYYNEFVGIPDLFNAPYQDNEAFAIGEEQSARVVDNNDAMGRVRVQFPWQEKKGEKTPWLRIATLHTGSGKGTHIIPEIGEEVLVAYESGNAEKPYAAGALYSGAETSGYNTAGNDLKVIKTRSGCMIFIDDNKGSILLQDTNGSKVFLDGQGNIDLNSAKKINLDSKEINLRAEKIKLESSELVDIKSYQTAKFTSFQTMNIEGTKDLKVSSTNLAMNAKENFKTTAQKVDLGAENQMKISSQAMEVHGTDKMDLKSPTLNKVTQAEKVSVIDGTEKDNQVIAIIKPADDYKGEFGIDYCEMDSKFDKIEKFQGTKVADIEYVYDESTKQYKKGVTDIEKQNLVKKMYYSSTYFGKNYLATWMNVPMGIVAKINLKTILIKEGEGKEKKDEFMTFKENPNFEITYDGKINSAIQLKGIEKSKEYKNIAIKALKTFETTEYIEIVDESENIVGIIEMAPNKVEELEIKIIPVVLKATTPATQDAQAEALYNNAIAAKNANNLNLIDTFNKQSLNQAGIKSKMISNPKGAEKIVINVANEYKNYWDATGKFLKDWKFNPADTDLTKKPLEWKNEDGQIVYKNDNQSTRMLLDELEEDYYKNYGRAFKGAIIFVVNEDYNKPYDASGKTSNTLGYSQNNPLRSQGTIIFKGGIEDADTYTHEVAHMLSLEHTFFDDEKDFNDTNASITLNENEAPKYDSLIQNRNELIEQENKIIARRNENIKEYGKNDDGTIDEEYVKGEQKIIAESELKLKEYEQDISQFEKEKNDYLRRRDLEISCGYRIKQKTTKNFMDYDIKRLYFSKFQCKTMNNETKDFYTK